MDIKTIVVLNVMLVFGMGIFVFSSTSKIQTKVIKIWNLANLIYLLGILLMTFQNILINFISMFIANMCVLLGLSLITTAVLKIKKESLNNFSTYIINIISCILMIYYLYVDYSYIARSFVMAGSVMSIYIIFLIRINIGKSLFCNKIRIVINSIFTLSIITFLARIILLISDFNDSDNFFSNDIITTIFTITQMFNYFILNLILFDFLIKDYQNELSCKINQLEKNKNAVTKMNIELESKVSERTFELTKSNKKFENEIERYKKVKNQLIKAKEEAEIANYLKDYFLSNINHDIKIPITGISGMVHLMDYTSLNTLQKKYLKSINDSLDKLMDVVNNIVDISKLEKNAINIKKCNFKFSEFCDELTKKTRKKVHKKGLNFEYKFESSIPEELVSDINIINQIIDNLVNNALKFTEEGTIEIGVTILKEINQSIELKFYVKDTGVGISEDMTKNIYTPFFQGDISYIKTYHKMELGLAICKNLVDKLNGEINFKRNENRGIEFYFVVSLLKFSESSEKVKK